MVIVPEPLRAESFAPFGDVLEAPLDLGPKAANGRPDTGRARAFLAGPNQGVTYRVDTWHHPLTVLDRPARFAVLIWLERSATDEEFVTLDRPFTVDVPA